jgi:hypothetical protein
MYIGSLAKPDKRSVGRTVLHNADPGGRNTRRALGGDKCVGPIAGHHKEQPPGSLGITTDQEEFVGHAGFDR